MRWWVRRGTSQRWIIVAGIMFIVFGAAMSLLAVGSTNSPDSAAASPTPLVVTTPTPTTSAPPTTTAPAAVETTTSTTLAPGADRVTLASVTDGDTVRVRFTNGTVEKVRLVGINTPETGECLASEATGALTELLEGEEFTMTTDVSDRDRYDRLLRYLWLDDGTFVNESLVADGLALARDYPPDSTFVDRLATAQQRADAAAIGLWAPDACGPSVDSDIQIVSIEFDAPGDDHENLNGEWVEIINRGTTTETMSSWVLKDESASHRYTFPSGFALDAGSAVTVHTGCGSDTDTALFWCSNKGAVWNNGGDTAFLLDPAGNLVDKRSY